MSEIQNSSIFALDDISDEEMSNLIDGTVTDFDEGGLVTGTVVKIERDEVLLDIGYKSEGVIPSRELSIRKDVNPAEVVSMGEEIEALVLQKEDKEGRLVLSKKRAEYERAWNAVADRLFSTALALVDRIARDFPLYERPASMAELAEKSDPIIHHTFDAGEGILIPAEILEQASRGVRNFVILQPFGCLPNHVVGRGIIKRVKELYPDAQVLPLDYDPDVSQANIENRLQMLVMDARPDVAPGEGR